MDFLEPVEAEIPLFGYLVFVGIFNLLIYHFIELLNDFSLAATLQTDDLFSK